MTNTMIDVGALTAFQQGDPQAALDAAVADVRDECGWHIAPSQSETVTVRGRGSGILLLPSLHVTEVTSVTVDGTLVDPADYDWSSAGTLRRTTGWFGDGAEVVVAFTHGYAQTPEDLQDVILARAARRVDDPKGNVAQRSKGPFSEQYNTGGVSGFDSDREARTVRRYRILRVGK